MTMQTIVVETRVPQDVYLTLQASGMFRETLADQSRQLLALRFYQDRVLSLGKAARLAGLTVWKFIDLLADNKIAVIDYSEEELQAEFAAIDQLEAELG